MKKFAAYYNLFIKVILPIGIILAIPIGILWSIYGGESMDDRMKALEEAQALAKTGITQEQPKVRATVTLTQSQVDYMEELIKDGMVKYELAARKVYINPALWQAADYKLKEDLTVSCAMYCAMKSGSESNIINVYDKQSGKQLAKYSVWGYKVL